MTPRLFSFYNVHRIHVMSILPRPLTEAGADTGNSSRILLAAQQTQSSFDRRQYSAEFLPAPVLVLNSIHIERLLDSSVRPDPLLIYAYL
jgi:hypothetical protein